MADRGRKNKPHALKLLEGTARAGDKPDVELPEPDSYDPPAWLTNEDALDEWDRLVDLLKPVKVLTAGDLTSLAHLCALHGDLVKLIRAGMKPSASDRAEFRTCLNEFGLTPASRGKVKAVDAGKKSGFGELRNPRSAGAGGA